MTPLDVTRPRFAEIKPTWCLGARKWVKKMEYESTSTPQEPVPRRNRRCNRDPLGLTGGFFGVVVAEGEKRRVKDVQVQGMKREKKLKAKEAQVRGASFHRFV